jgi:hypothetical protein
MPFQYAPHQAGGPDAGQLVPALLGDERQVAITVPTRTEFSQRGLECASGDPRFHRRLAATIAGLESRCEYLSIGAGSDLRHQTGTSPFWP